MQVLSKKHPPLYVLEQKFECCGRVNSPPFVVHMFVSCSLHFPSSSTDISSEVSSSGSSAAMYSSTFSGKPVQTCNSSIQGVLHCLHSSPRLSFAL